MIDLDFLHAAVQVPTAIVKTMLAVAVLMRWQSFRTGSLTVADPSFVLWLGLCMMLAALKQDWWTIWGALKHHDLSVAARAMQSSMVPIVLNVLITLTGLVALWRAAIPFAGRQSTLAIALSVVVMASVSLIITLE